MPARFAFILYILVFSCGFGAELNSIKTTRTETQTSSGLVSPPDPDGKNFYLQNVDGLIEVVLTIEC